MDWLVEIDILSFPFSIFSLPNKGLVSREQAVCMSHHMPDELTVSFILRQSIAATQKYFVRPEYSACSF